MIGTEKKSALHLISMAGRVAHLGQMKELFDKSKQKLQHPPYLNCHWLGVSSR